jgi:hypothetical protein
MLPTSPWLLPSLVAVQPAAADLDSRPRLPDGTIMVPDDPKEPCGAVRVLRRGFGE